VLFRDGLTTGETNKHKIDHKEALSPEMQILDFCTKIGLIWSQDSSSALHDAEAQESFQQWCVDHHQTLTISGNRGSVE